MDYHSNFGQNFTVNGTELPNLEELGNLTDTIANNVAKSKLYHIPPLLENTLLLSYGAICAIALIGNVLVLCLVVSSKPMWTVTNILVCNLAFADLIIFVFAVPFHFQAALAQRWDFARILCPICPFTQELSVIVSVFTLAAIAIHRYHGIMHPLAESISKSIAFGLLLIIWLVAILIALPTLLDFTVIDYPNKDKTVITPFCKSDLLSDTFKWFYYQCLVMVQYFVPLVIISVVYYKMGSHLWNYQPPGNQEKNRDEMLLGQKRKVTKMTALVVFMFGVCWLPYQMYNFLQVYFPRINDFYYINIIWLGIHWLAMGNSCVNPFIYAIYNKKFKEEIERRVSTSYISRRASRNSVWRLNNVYADGNVQEAAL